MSIQRGENNRRITSERYRSWAGGYRGVVGHREYTEENIDADFWKEVFGADVVAGPPKRIGEGQVGMNLRFALQSEDPTVPSSVVVKMASPDPTSRATGISLRNYEREVKFYNEIVETLDVRSPRSWFADWHEDGGDIAIVLEDMAPSEQGDQIDACGIEHARLAVEQLVKMQGPRWNDPTLADIDWLQRRDAADAERLSGLIGMVLPGFLATYTDAILRDVGQGGLDFISTLATKIPEYIAAKDAPFTITHGDYRLDNLLFATTPDGVPCAVVDWQHLDMAMEFQTLRISSVQGCCPKLVVNMSGNWLTNTSLVLSPMDTRSTMNGSRITIDVKQSRVSSWPSWRRKLSDARNAATRCSK